VARKRRLQRFLAGAAEAPLTDFTLAQMQALQIYSPYGANELALSSI